MGNCCSCKKNGLSYEQADKKYSSMLIESNSAPIGKEWTLLDRNEMTQVLNRLHLAPFANTRRNIILSIRTRLISFDDFCSIIKLIPTEEEKFVTLKMLFGNIALGANNWNDIYAFFCDEKTRLEVTKFIEAKNDHTEMSSQHN